MGESTRSTRPRAQALVARVGLTVLVSVVGALALAAFAGAGNGKSSKGKHAPVSAKALKVSKTAKTSFVHQGQWQIAKTVTPAEWNLFRGDRGTSKYTISVTRSGAGHGAWTVSGTITIKNPNKTAATVTSVTDTLTGAIEATVNCGVAFPFALAGGKTLKCSYTAALPDGASRTNTATVTTTGAVPGGSATAHVKFSSKSSKSSKKGASDTVKVVDGKKTWVFKRSGSVSYERTFSCDKDAGTHTNTATIVGTGQSASATVVVRCFALGVTKDVSTSIGRAWKWSIAKSATPKSLSVNQGQLGSVVYRVALAAKAKSSTGHVASGTIRVHNPAPIDAVLLAVTDVVSSKHVAAVDCKVSFPYTLPAGQTLECTYSVTLPNASPRKNTATAVLLNRDHGSHGKGHHGSSTSKGKKSSKASTRFTASAPVSFAGAVPSGDVDRCVQVTDTLGGVLGRVCAGDASKAFQYTLTFGTAGTNANVVLGCGKKKVTNTARFLTESTKRTGSAKAKVTVNVICTTTTPPVTPPVAPSVPPTIDLGLAKTATSPTPLNGIVTYRLTVTNKGPSGATNVQLVDPAPGGIRYLSATQTQGTCSVAATLVTCSLGAIPAGGTVVVIVRARATSVGTLRNTATVVGQGGAEANPADNVASARTVVPRPAKPPARTRGVSATGPAASACLLLTVSPRGIRVDRKPNRVRVLVTAANQRQRGVRVVIRGAGVTKAARTARNGVAIVTVNPRRAGILTVTAVERDRRVCGPRRIGVIAAFAVPLAG